MRFFLDACVLYPVATREILLGYARAGGFTPLWSPRVVEEWARAAAAKQGPEAEARARGDAALMRAWFPGGETAPDPAREAALWSPDPADAHVIAAAEASGAEAILTFNIRDFPMKALRPVGLDRLHPDEFLRGAFLADEARLTDALRPMRDVASARNLPFRRFLKRAALPRLGKAWEAAQGG